MEFDYNTERCFYCDGHWRHYCPCPYIDEDFRRCASHGRPGHECERSMTDAERRAVADRVWGSKPTDP